MFKGLKMLGAAAIAAILMAAPAQAATVIDFSTGLAGTGGTITGSGGNLIGSNIPIGAVTISGAPSNNTTFLVSGTATGSGIGGPFGSLNFNTAANTLSITGCIASLGVTSANCGTNVLLSGTFQGWSTDAQNDLLNAFGIDTKNSQLLSAIGVPTNTPFAFFGFSLTTGGDANPQTGARQVISTDIRNTAVPEPATMMLLGTGLLAAFRARRKLA